MSAPDRGLQHPHHASRSASHASTPSASTDSSHARRQSRRLSTVVDVQDASRVIECSQVERQLRFQHLVRHYLSQILYGCNSAYCDTPTCFSCNKRNASKPFRPPTQLTARALAYYLASQNNPHRGLCPHELKVSPASLEIEGAIDTGIQQGGNGADREYIVYPKVCNMAQQSVIPALNKRHQAKKDKKSLGQNLYDSVTMIYSYSKQIPSPISVLASLRSFDNAPEHVITARPKSPANAASLPEARKHVPNAEPIPRANGQSVTPPTYAPARILRRNSQQNLRAHSNSHPVQVSHGVLDNGQHIHRIPYHPPNTPIQSKKPHSSDPPTLDGASEPPRLSISKTGKKHFTLGGETVPTMGRSKPLTTATDNVGKMTRNIDRTGPTLPVFPNLNCDTLDELKEEVYHHRKYQSAEFNFVVDYDNNRRFRPTKPFVNRSLFYTLSNPNTLLESFHDQNEAFSDSPLPHLDSARLTHSFRDWSRRNGALIFDSLWVALEALFTYPPELDVQKSPRLRPSRKGASTDSSSEQSSSHQKDTSTPPRYLSNTEAAHIVIVCIHALTSLVPVGWAHTWAQLRKLRSWGVILPNAAPNTDAFTHPFLDIIDELEYEPAIRLADRLLRGIGARTCFEHILGSLHQKEETQYDPEHKSTDASLVDVIIKHLTVVERVALAGKRRMKSNHSVTEDPGWTVTATFMEWLRTIIIKKWDGKAEISKWGSVGTAVMILDKFHTNRGPMNLRSNMFEMPYFNERLDTVDESLKYLNWGRVPQPNTLHILEYPNLFPAQHIVAYFRTINFTSMMAQYDHTTRVHQMQRSLDIFLREPFWWVIKYRMKVTLSEYLVLDVSRESPLKDTLDQLWGQERRMLLKPLKVKMGRQEGEVGLDHGGVTYEFFRVVLGEAFKPDNGMFTLDPQTRMTWFQLRILEPLWKFEMLGILFSLAIYNGITLPVTFPLALYHFLLPSGSPFRDREVDVDSLDYIKDGWPGLAKAFEDLLSWSDGDVGDVIMREYAFSYEVFGQKVDHNMKEPFQHKPEGSSSPNLSQLELSMVTNENREQFVRDYIHVLTYASVAPQLHSFLKGFMTCLNPKSLYFFTPSTLRNLVEGTQHISIPDLKRCAKYEEGYTATHSTIRDFWAIVEQYSQEDCRHLLEFVTASDRVPVTGYESITFHIVRIGGDTDSLPTSSTCFGKLYLPEYPDKETMRKKMELAIRNSKGFGVV